MIKIPLNREGKFINSFIIFFALFPLYLSGQDSMQRARVREHMQEIVREKLKGYPLLSDTGGEKIILERRNVEKDQSSSVDEIQVTNDNISESEVHAAINPIDSNNIVLSPIKYYTSPSITIRCPVFYSRNFGKNWTESTFESVPVNVSNPVVVGGGDPVLAFDANGRLYFSWISLYGKDNKTIPTYWKMLWAYSDDGGATWIHPADDTIGFSAGNISTQNFDQVYDKEWLACDQSGSAYRNSLYVVYMKVDNIQGTEGIYVRKKRSANPAFDKGEVLITDNSFLYMQFGSIFVDRSGYVHVIFYGSKIPKVYGLYHCISKNGGASFSTPIKITNLKTPLSIEGINSKRIYPAPQISIDNSDAATSGNLYVTFTATGLNSSGTTGADIYFCKSTDGGQTWSTPIVVNDDNKSKITHQFYSAMAVSPKGTIMVSWYDGRLSDTTNREIKYYMSYSFDGGGTFIHNFPVSTVPTDFRKVGAGNFNFGVGEYNMVVSGRYYALPVWADGRKGTGDLDIYTAIVPINSTPVGIPEITPVTSKVSISDPYPQPAGNEVSVDIKMKEKTFVDIEIFTVGGQPAGAFGYPSLPIGENRLVFEISGYKPGQYFMIIRTNSGNFLRNFTRAGGN